jgi:hypothetical protein
MSNNTKIFSEAIAEAKAIRETAMANAKLALEEAFTPRIKEMMSSKLEALAEEDEMEEGYNEELEEGNMDSTENMDEISLEELLSELEGLEEGEKEEMEEGKEEIEENTDLEEAAADDEVGEITVDELKDIIRDVMADLMGGGEEMEGEEMEAEEIEGEEMEAEEEISLDEILAEIASLDETEDLNEKESPTMKNPASSAAAGADEIIRMVKAAAKKSPAIASKIMKALEDAGAAAGAAMRNEELEEAMNTISTLRSELNEVNLLNAKLLYVNKLFKAKTLNESQKVKVINAFDRAETVKEAKNIYETLNESLSVTKKSPLKENLSFASKAVGVADKKVIVESNDFVARMQKLAGIK